MCRHFPGLVTHLTVDVFDEWSPQALHGVALRHFQREESQLDQRGIHAIKVSWFVVVVVVCLSWQASRKVEFVCQGIQ